MLSALCPLPAEPTRVPFGHECMVVLTILGLVVLTRSGSAAMFRSLEMSSTTMVCLLTLGRLVPMLRTRVLVLARETVLFTMQLRPLACRVLPTPPPFAGPTCLLTMFIRFGVRDTSSRGLVMVN